MMSLKIPNASTNSATPSLWLSLGNLRLGQDNPQAALAGDIYTDLYIFTTFVFFLFTDKT